MNTLSDKAGENGTWLGGGGRLLCMQFQERQYILVIIESSFHVCLSAMVYVKHHNFKINKIHNSHFVSPLVLE